MIGKAFNPDQLGTINYKYDSSLGVSEGGGKLTQWNDLSGNDYHFTPNLPVFNPIRQAWGSMTVGSAADYAPTKFDNQLNGFPAIRFAADYANSKGLYVVETTYSTGNIVSYINEGSSDYWASLQDDNTGNTPSESVWWTASVAPGCRLKTTTFSPRIDYPETIFQVLKITDFQLPAQGPFSHSYLLDATPWSMPTDSERRLFKASNETSNLGIKTGPGLTDSRSIDTYVGQYMICVLKYSTNGLLRINKSDRGSRDMTTAGGTYENIVLGDYGEGLRRATNEDYFDGDHVYLLSVAADLSDREILRMETWLSNRYGV